MQYVYICGAVSEEMNDALGQSVAGNKFSLSMASALDASCGGNLTFISTAMVEQSVVDAWGGEAWEGKKLHLAKRGKRFVLAELKLRRSILEMISRIKKAHPGEQITVFLENSPFAGATACVALKKRLGISCYSITIDTPFAGEFQERGIQGRINGWMFRQGRKALRHFDGLISFTEDVKRELQVDIPFCEFAIGCQKDAIPEEMPQITAEKTAVYAGTLIYYNGIRELLQAFTMLDPAYQLHIYGYGPLEKEVKEAAQKYDNIVFHGRFDPAETSQILSQYQLLINPRQIDPGIENFTFPSKLVDYILTGKSVLSSNFKTLPPEYRDFVYILRDMAPETIAEGVRSVFEDAPAIRQTRGQAGIRYIKENQTYDKIADKIIIFVRN
jgi:glycosyltransferase involved in cell wall biosynthesis